jgi:hypothetical protein
MRKYLLMLGKVLGVVLFLFAFTTNDKSNSATDGKVVICHIPPGNPGNAHEIVVSTNAVQAHLNHGDHIGRCSCDNDDN